MAIERLKGDEAISFVAERIAALTIAGDMAGVARFTLLAGKLNHLRSVRAQ